MAVLLIGFIASIVHSIITWWKIVSDRLENSDKINAFTEIPFKKNVFNYDNFSSIPNIGAKCGILYYDMDIF